MGRLGLRKSASCGLPPGGTAASGEAVELYDGDAEYDLLRQGSCVQTRVSHFKGPVEAWL